MSYSSEIISLGRERDSCRYQAAPLPQIHLEEKENQAAIRHYDFMSEENEVTCTRYLREKKCEPLCIIQPNMTQAKQAQLLPICQANKQTSTTTTLKKKRKRMLFLY